MSSGYTYITFHWRTSFNRTLLLCIWKLTNRITSNKTLFMFDNIPTPLFKCIIKDHQISKNQFAVLGKMNLYVLWFDKLFWYTPNILVKRFDVDILIYGDVMWILAKIDMMHFSKIHLLWNKSRGNNPTSFIYLLMHSKEVIIYSVSSLQTTTDVYDDQFISESMNIPAFFHMLIYGIACGQIVYYFIDEINHGLLTYITLFTILSKHT